MTSSTSFAGNEQYAPYIASYVRFPLVYLLEEENDEIADLAPEINQFTQEMGAKWIVDGGIEEDWEGYCSGSTAWACRVCWRST